MKLKILGSAAAEAVPAFWCECATCQEARKRGGKDLRRRTSYYLDDDTLIDFGPDAFWQMTEFGIDLTKIKRIIFTHQHSDHLNPMDLEWRMAGGWFSQTSHELEILGAKSVFVRLMNYITTEGMHYDFSQFNIKPQILEPGRQIKCADLTVLPLPADHDPGKSPFIYVLERGGKKVLIGNDSGFFPEAAWQLLAGQQIDLAILDCTFGVAHPEYDGGHMGAAALLRAMARLLECGGIKETATVVANHFSHNGAPLHADLEAFFAGSGVQVGYDGMDLLI